MDAILRRLRSLLMRETIVVHPRLLVCKVLQAVPLRARLCVDVNLVIQRRETKRRQVHYFLFERLSTEARELYVLQAPV
jgi:hypothetical protein